MVVKWVVLRVQSFVLQLHSILSELDDPPFQLKTGVELRVEEVRAASQRDSDRMAAQLAFTEGSKLFHDQGNAQSLRKAIEKYEKSLKIRQALEDASGEATTLYIIGIIYYILGDPQQALKRYENVRLILRSVENHPILASALNEIGVIHVFFMDPKRALDYYKQARQLFHTMGDRLNEATTLNNIGQAYQTMRKQEEALKYFNQAKAILLLFPDHPTLPVTLVNLGFLYFSRHNPQKALANYNRALKIFRDRKDLSGQAKTLNNLGQVYGWIGRNQAALEAYRQAYSIFSDLKDSANEANALANMGMLEESMGHNREALDAYQKIIEALEKLRASATIEEIKAGLNGLYAPAYKASLLNIKLGQSAQAFNLTEFARARTFLDRVGNARPNLLDTTNATLIKDRQELEAKLDSLERRFEQEGDITPSLKAEYDEAQYKYESLLLRIKLTSPNQDSLQNIKPLTLPEIQNQLDKDITLLSYFVGPEKTLAFVVTRDTFYAIEIAVKESDLTNRITWIHHFSNLNNASSESLRLLYNWLIAPLKQYIKTPMVGIIPHKALHYLPFAALTDGSHYFGDERTLFYLPSASVWPLIKMESKPLGTQMLALAQSRAPKSRPLNYADAEVEDVARLYDTQPLKTGKALKSEFLKRASEYSIIHIAAHTDLKTASPLFYRIMLAADEADTAALEVRRIYELDLTKASLVVLSACQTEIGAQSEGDDFVTLNRAFIYAGAPTVIASLWVVDDKSTSYLMRSFYKNLKNGKSKAEALKAAQLETREQYGSPYYWAAFVLTGDPGR